MILYLIALVLVTIVQLLGNMVAALLTYTITYPSSALTSAATSFAPQLGLLDSVFPISIFLQAVFGYIDILGAYAIYKVIDFATSRGW